MVLRDRPGAAGPRSQGHRPDRDVWLGMIPVHVQIGKAAWETAMFPKMATHLVPVKASIRKAERLQEGDTVTMRLEVRL